MKIPAKVSCMPVLYEKICSASWLSANTSRYLF